MSADVGLTPGQSEQLRGWLLDQVAAAEAQAKALGGASSSPVDKRWAAFHHGQAQAWRDAEVALRVASVGALARPAEPAP